MALLPKPRAQPGLSQPWYTKSQNIAMNRASGGLRSPIGGRTDRLAVKPRAGSYVIPADIVSGLGQGNTSAGMKVLDNMFKSGPFGMPKARLPRATPRKYADGGKVDILAAGGEYIIPPDSVAEIGGGDMAAGHDVLDAFVAQIRDSTIKDMQALPGPKQ